MDKQSLNRCYRYCFSLTGDEGEAFDLLHSAIEKMLMKDRMSEVAAGPWFFRIIRNLWIDLYRRETLAPIASEEETLQVVDLNEPSLEDIQVARGEISSLLSHLSAEDRHILYLQAVEGCTAEEIASVCDCTKGAILVRIHRLKKSILAKKKGEDHASTSK